MNILRIATIAAAVILAGLNVGLTADGQITKLQLRSESALAANITSLGERAKTAASTVTGRNLGNAEKQEPG
jgi:hypothetical protein